MARKTATQSNNSRSDNFQAADAFLRLEVVDGAGNKHRLPKDVALYLKNHISEQLINKANEDEEFEFKLVGKVHVVDNSPKEAVKF